jgi:hypothetical protein
VHGLADVYLIRNFAHPTSGLNQLRAFDFRDRLSLNYLGGALALGPRPVGFRLDVGAGNTADVFEQQDPAVARHPTWARATSYVGQAFATVLLPFATLVALDLGKFSTPVGIEENTSLGNWNYSRSLLFTWAEPTLHTGVRATAPLTKTFALSLFWVNGWDANILDGSGMRTFAAAATWKPRGELAVTVVEMAGPERPPTALAGPLSFRSIFDAYVVLEPWSGVSFAVVADVGHDAADGGVGWWGVSWYSRLQLSRWAGVAVRGEYLSDPDGFATGTRQSVSEVTATADARARAGRLRAVGRLEYRHDQSTTPVFDGTLPASRTRQDTLTAALMCAF